MIELSILELLYLVLTFFLVVIGTLLTLVLLRTLKILAVGVEITNYYWEVKKLIVYYSQVPFVIKDKIFDYLAAYKQEEEEDEWEKA